MKKSFDYSDYQSKCRNCFKVFDVDKKSLKYEEKHKIMMENIVGFEIPAHGSEKICSGCQAVITEFSKIKNRMIVLQKGFNNHMNRQQDTEMKTKDQEMLQQVPKKISNSLEIERVSDEYFKELIDKQRNSFACLICHKYFSFKFSAVSHLKTVHLKIKGYKCDICEYRGGSKCNLQRHVQRNHIPDFSLKVKCPNCGSFISKKYLLQHRMRMHSGEVEGELKCRKRYRCCNKTYVSLGSTLKHCKKFHKSNKVYEIIPNEVKV
ncbi:CLUMA_CG009262, isoform A [Clunio marinus]|uniref:CLUMA_CG009262, isoform A n=1 Tax=Clunio marinus TaxID=568069 RepID=A0A1J1I7U8_9DIPT|nr:CLUMA_CG009262, isoform A [Clunio marinus]